MSYITIEIAFKAIDSYIKSFQTINLTELGILCPTGTIQNINTTCLNLLYNGSDGNKTSAGYFIDYNFVIGNIKNFYYFQFLPPSVESIPQNQNIIYTTGTTIATWPAPLILQGPASGTEETYIPGKTGCLAWGTVMSYQCSGSLGGTIICGQVPVTKCIQSGWIPPIFCNPPCITTYNKNYILTIYGLKSNVTFGYYYSSQAPSLPITYTYITTSSEINNPIVGYIYDITINFNTLSYTSFTVTGVNVSLTNEQVNEILHKIFTTDGKLESTLRKKILSAVIKIIINPSL